MTVNLRRRKSQQKQKSRRAATKSMSPCKRRRSPSNDADSVPHQAHHSSNPQAKLKFRPHPNQKPRKSHLWRLDNRKRLLRNQLIPSSTLVAHKQRHSHLVNLSCLHLQASNQSNSRTTDGPHGMPLKVDQQPRAMSRAQNQLSSNQRKRLNRPRTACSQALPICTSRALSQLNNSKLSNNRLASHLLASRNPSSNSRPSLQKATRSPNL